MGRRLDLTGQRFGRLIALESTEGRGADGSVVWRCLCDCDTETLVSSNNLRRGNTKSCGCLAYELTAARRTVDLTGQRFGKLIALSPTDERVGGKVVWRCICDCGEETAVISTNLTRGNTKSCGCFSVELTIARFTTHGMTHTSEYSSWCHIKRREVASIFDSSWSLEDESILQEFFSECVLCGSTEDLETDHLLPLSLGFGLTPDNVVRLCRSCNGGKNNTYITDLPKLDRQKLLEASWNFQDYYQKARFGDGTEKPPLVGEG